jgi:hypothetical protein
MHKRDYNVLIHAGLAHPAACGDFGDRPEETAGEGKRVDAPVQERAARRSGKEARRRVGDVRPRNVPWKPRTSPISPESTSALIWLTIGRNRVHIASMAKTPAASAAATIRRAEAAL